MDYWGASQWTNLQLLARKFSTLNVSDKLLAVADITLPILVAEVAPIRCGRVLPVFLLPAETRLMAHSVNVARGNRVVTLDENTCILVTPRRSITAATDCDYVLSEHGGVIRWLKHPRLIQTQQALVTSISALRDSVRESWRGVFSYREEAKDSNGIVVSEGLRPPQIGGGLLSNRL